MKEKLRSSEKFGERCVQIEYGGGGSNGLRIKILLEETLTQSKYSAVIEDGLAGERLLRGKHWLTQNHLIYKGFGVDTVVVYMQGGTSQR